jgi:hypothetical protein
MTMQSKRCIPIKFRGPDNKLTMVMIVNKLFTFRTTDRPMAAYWPRTIRMQNVPAVLDSAAVIELHLLKFQHNSV